MSSLKAKRKRSEKRVKKELTGHIRMEHVEGFALLKGTDGECKGRTHTQRDTHMDTQCRIQSLFVCMWVGSKHTLIRQPAITHLHLK